MKPVNISDFEAVAKEMLPQMAYDYFSSGSNDEITLRENCEAYKRIFLKYRVLVDVENIDTSLNVLSKTISMPVLIAPTAFHRMAHKDGETAVARASGNAGTVMILSTLSNTDMEEVVESSDGDVWFQLYVYRDRDVTRDIIQRAAAAGCKAIVLTADTPYLGIRERDVRNQFNLPEGLSVKNLLPASKHDLPMIEDSGLGAYVQKFLSPSLTWKDIQWIKSVSGLPLFLKGIACAEDALLSLDNGADGIIVSNHGGRQLDTCRATIDVLPEVAAAVSGKLEILIDGGIRRGTDVLKAIALGANAVCIGRPVIWGLASSGEEGVTSILEFFRKELTLSMALCGCRSIQEITKNIIAR